MSVEVKVPVLPESVPDATLLDWKKQPGDRVERDEILIELETDKIVLEVPAPEGGVLAEVLKKTGDVVVSEDVLARIDAAAAGAGAAKPAESAGAAAKAPAGGDTDGQPERGASKGEDGGDGPALSPAVRKLVDEHSLDASAIEGTGRGGRITKADVLSHMEERAAAPAAAPAAPAAPAAAPARAPAAEAPTPHAPAPGSRGEHREPMSRLRQRIAERLVQAQHTAAILTTFNEVNMAPVMALRSRYKDAFEKKHGVRLGFMSFFAKAAVLSLQRFPAVNAYIEGTETVYHDYCDIGIAVGSPRGLVVPILRNVEAMSFADIEAGIADFGKRAADGTLGMDDLTGGTFTISNGGVFGSLLSTPILNPPQSAILGMHKTQERPVAENGAVVVRPVMYLALSYDHRIIDGREAVQFLVSIKDSLEDPARLLLDV